MKVRGGVLAAMQRGTTYGGCLPGGQASFYYQLQGNRFVAVVDLLEAIEIWSEHNKGTSAASMSMRDPCWHWHWHDLNAFCLQMKVTSKFNK